MLENKVFTIRDDGGGRSQRERAYCRDGRRWKHAVANANLLVYCPPPHTGDSFALRVAAAAAAAAVAMRVNVKRQR